MPKTRDPDDNDDDADFHVNVEDGCSGLISLLMEGSFLFPEKKYEFIETARKIGILTWQCGMSTKSNGLATGTAGNAYALHALARGY